MIFHRIILNNLFSYRDEQVFEFVPVDGDSAKLVLVMGRNGFGKTSLLNAVKLLFLGSDDKGQRQVGFPPSGLTRNAYVLGNGSSWSGIMNRQARAVGETHCSVRVEIGPPEKVTFVAERRWTIEGGTFSPDQEILEVQVEGRTFAGPSADTRLDEFLPRELVPFFFFDGEEIQFLAEGSDIHRAEAMERLLSLSFVNGVEAELEGLTKNWRREALPEEVQVEIAEEEGKLKKIDKQFEALSRKKEGLEGQIRELEEKAKTLKHKMEILRGSGALADAKGLEHEIASLENELQEEQNKIAYSLAEDAPLLANSSLLRACLEPLRSVVDQKTKAAESVLDTLFKVLPERLFNEPPQPRDPLSEEQCRFYENKLKRILDAFGVQDEATPEFLAGLDLVRARQLQEKFLGVSATLRVFREDRARRLREISRKKAELEEKRAESREAEFGSSEAAEQHRELEAEFVSTQQQVGKLAAELEANETQVIERSAEKEVIGKRIRDLERQAHDAAKSSKRLEIAIGLRDSFKHYRHLQREAKREQIEDTLNECFNLLMSGHDLIKRIKVNEDFYLRFLDREEKEIGHSTISHGMRQLSVTALLWALKDVSGRPLPIIVDTPLARIDKQNQDNLLLHYYPSAADQVVVLATDSEIDERKFGLIRPHLSRVLKLSNPGGEQSSFTEIVGSKGQDLSWEAVANG